MRKTRRGRRASTKQWLRRRIHEIEVREPSLNRISHGEMRFLGRGKIHRNGFPRYIDLAARCSSCYSVRHDVPRERYNRLYVDSFVEAVAVMTGVADYGSCRRCGETEIELFTPERSSRCVLWPGGRATEALELFVEHLAHLKEST